MARSNNKRKGSSKSRENAGSDSDPHPADELILQQAANRAAEPAAALASSAPDEAANTTGSRLPEAVPQAASAPAAKRQRKPFGVTVVEEGVTPQERSSVLQSLLRAPRYFDPDFDGSGIKCFKCGGSGHMAWSCPNEEKRRPCFLCASLDHERRDCPFQKSSVSCFKCGWPGHVARECTRNPSTPLESECCLRCGQAQCEGAGNGENYRYCQQEYLPQDLQHVLCIHCGLPGHLSCKKIQAKVPKPTCAGCSEHGHLIDDCWKKAANSSTNLPTRASASAYSYGNGAEAAAQRPLGSRLNGRLSAPAAVPAYNASDRWQLNGGAAAYGQQSYGSPQYQHQHYQQPGQYQYNNHDRHQEMYAHAAQAGRMLGAGLQGQHQYGLQPQKRVFPY